MGADMTDDGYDFDGYIELNTQEMNRLNNGDKFLTVIRSAKTNNVCRYGYPGDILGAKESNSLRPKYNVKVVSNFLSKDKWIIVLARLHNSANEYLFL
jgi:hypothetical protein